MASVAAYIQGVIERVHEAEHVYTDDITVKFGHVIFKSPETLVLNNEEITSRAVLLATGSHPAIPMVEGLTEVGYLTNEDVFALTNLPASIIVVGGGPIGVELGQAMARLGVQVTLLQRSERILPREDPEVSSIIASVLQSEGVTIVTNTHLIQASHNGNKKVVTAQQNNQIVRYEADEILVAVGRQPNIDGLNLEAAGVAYDVKGIKVDNYLQTSAAHIFAIGDVIGEYLFTHVAAYQAGVAVRNALLPIGKKKVNYSVVPWCTFTDPEAARIGLTLAEAEGQHQQVRVVTFPWADIDRALTENAPTGFIKLILAGKKEKIVGVHMVGKHAGELLGEIGLAMQHHLTLSDILGTIHAYPTFHSGLQQAAFEAYLSGTAVQTNRKIVSMMLRRFSSH
jgi:pyruvate/2-oxoglutarate dehydrogenase complex dihydrolipoamide dehydrogenase (E3) component